MSEAIKLTDAQRASAIDRLDENLSLRSGAGCGKTYVLARRFTELLLRCPDADDPLSRFVALTFTDKAAIEMSQRVRKMLGDFAASATDPAERRRLLGWIEALPEARISTIHSFCAALLRTYAIDAGIDPAFFVCNDDLTAKRMVAEAADQAVLAEIEQGRSDAAAAVERIGYDRLVRDVRKFVETRCAWDPAAYMDAEATFERWAQQAERQSRQAWAGLDADAIRSEIAELDAITCTDASDKLAVYRDEQLSLVSAILDDPVARTGETFRRLNAKPKTIGGAKAWGSKETVVRIRNGVKSIVEALAAMSVYYEQPSRRDREAAELLATIVRLALATNDAYAATKRLRGMLDFDDLLFHTHRLLTTSAEARESLARGVSQLLIDEAQDTDIFQIQLLEMLIFGTFGTGKLPDGRLFLVGDEKQSIYRFRGAQVQAFEDLCRRIGQDRTETLDLSFRTHAAGVAFVNHLFAPLMGTRYAPIRAHRTEAPPSPSVEILLASGNKDNPITDKPAASAAQAQLTAQRIGEMIDGDERIVWDEHTVRWRPAQARDIAILFSRMTHSLDYERELARRGIAYHVVAGTGFLKQQEIFDLLNALRAIDNPFDDIALMGVLRSSLFGLDDNALMHVAEAFEPPYLPALVQWADAQDGTDLPAAAWPGELAGPPDSDRQTLALASRLLWNLHSRKDSVEIDALLQELLDATGYEAAMLSQFRGRRTLGNVRKLLEHARSAVAVESPSLADFITQMSEMVLDESRYEQAAEAGEAENVVRLMTIHKAKGLEFPVVFIPDLNAGRQGFTGALLNRPDWGLTYRLQPDADDSTADQAELPLSFRLAKLLEDEDCQAEDVRKLYVAATRHRDHLVFVGADFRTKDGDLRAKTSYLRKMDDVLGFSGVACPEGGTLPYGPDGRYKAIVRTTPPRRAVPRKGAGSQGEKLAAAAKTATDLADAIVKAGARGDTPPLVAPIPQELGSVELAVTAMSDFEQCPMLYRWRYELRVPAPAQTGLQQPSRAEPDARAGMEPMTLGTLYHKCMERLDFDSPQDAEALLRRAAGEVGLADRPGLEPLAAELRQMLDHLVASPLAEKIRSAKRTFRELDFMLDLAPAVLNGQIDLLFQDADERWHIVDYKSDRVGDEGIAAHAQRYELQMGVYAAAVAGRFAQTPATASLYFLRSGSVHEFSFDRPALGALRSRVADLAGKIISAGRTGEFPACQSPACDHCAYRPLCNGARPT